MAKRSCALQRGKSANRGLVVAIAAASVMSLGASTAQAATAPVPVLSAPVLSASVPSGLPAAEHVSAQTSGSSAATAAQPTISNRSRPTISGSRRYSKVLTASNGAWSITPSKYYYRWLRNGRDIRGAYHKTYKVRPEDVGKRLSVRVAATKPKYRTGKATSGRTAAIKHRVDVKRTVTFVVRRDGASGDMGKFTRLAGRTMHYPAGWRGNGIRFKKVSRGGDFTLVFAKASRVPAYSSACSSTYSCRVGRYVIINETRWRKGTSAWNRSGKSLRDYQNMVINHETGHFFGRGHLTCPRRGALAPVMQQQSKSLQGCKANPWPTARER